MNIFKQIGISVLIAFTIAVSLSQFIIVENASAAQQLIGYWSFDEGTGTQAHDYSGNNLFGTLMGNTSWTQGISGTALTFDGVDDFVDILDAPAFDNAPTQGFTYSAWIKATSFPDPQYNMIMGHFLPYVGVRGNCCNYRTVVSILTDPDFDPTTNAVQVAAQGATTLAPNTWYHVAATYSAPGTLSLYINGKLDATLPVTGLIVDANDHFLIGKYTSTNTNYEFTGVIDEVKIYNYALSETEILNEITVLGAGKECTTSCASGLYCDTSLYRCVPQTQNRNIGTWCSTLSHCNTGSGTLDLTCNISANICVGATANVKCINNDINNNALYGKTSAELDSSERCDEGLFCDPDEGSCQNDFGESAIPADKLGETATDIRDQIRNLINISLGFLGVIGVIITIYGGFTWMTAAGDDEKVSKAKKTIIAGLIGTVIIGIAWTIVSYILTITQQIS